MTQYEYIKVIMMLSLLAPNLAPFSLEAKVFDIYRLGWKYETGAIR